MESIIITQEVQNLEQRVLLGVLARYLAARIVGDLFIFTQRNLEILQRATFGFSDQFQEGTSYSREDFCDILNHYNRYEDKPKQFCKDIILLIYGVQTRNNFFRNLIFFFMTIGIFFSNLVHRKKQYELALVLTNENKDDVVEPTTVKEEKVNVNTPPVVDQHEPPSILDKHASYLDQGSASSNEPEGGPLQKYTKGSLIPLDLGEKSAQESDFIPVVSLEDPDLESNYKVFTHYSPPFHEESDIERQKLDKIPGVVETLSDIKRKAQDAKRAKDTSDLSRVLYNQTPSTFLKITNQESALAFLQTHEDVALCVHNFNIDTQDPLCLSKIEAYRDFTRFTKKMNWLNGTANHLLFVKPEYFLNPSLMNVKLSDGTPFFEVFFPIYDSRESAEAVLKEVCQTFNKMNNFSQKSGIPIPKLKLKKVNLQGDMFHKKITITNSEFVPFTAYGQMGCNAVKTKKGFLYAPSSKICPYHVIVYQDSMSERWGILLECVIFNVHRRKFKEHKK